MTARLLLFLTSLVPAMSLAAAGPGDTGAARSAEKILTTKVAEPVFRGDSYVYETGRGHEQTLVLIHGIGGQGGMDFREMMATLGRQYHVVAFDLPGFGRATRANLLYTPPAYVNFIKYVTEKFTDGPFMLLGHSLGGALALRYAAAFPRDVERLVVVSAAGILHRSSYSQYLSHLGIDLLPVFYPKQKEDLGGLAGAVLSRLEKLNLEPEIVLSSANLRQAALQGDPSKIAGLALVLDDFSKVLPQVTAPTLIVWGADDPVAPVRTGHLLANVLPHARLTVLDQAEHVPMRESPAAFRAAVMPFLAAPDAVAAVSVDRAAPRANAPRNADCNGEKARSFTGDYDTLVLRNCSGVRIRDARIRELRAYDSTLEIVDSEIGGDTGGMNVFSTRITMTGGRVFAPVAITARDSQFDMAGVTLQGKTFSIKAPVASRAVFSVSRVESAHAHGEVHGFYPLDANNPL